MQALIALGPAVSSFLGTAAPAVATGGAAAASGLSTLSTVLGIGGGLYQALYQRQIARSAAKVADANAERASFASQVSAQDRDIEAAAILAEGNARRAHSGFSVSSGTFARIDRRNRVMARRDAERIRQEGDLEAAQYKEKAAEARAEARNIGIDAIFDTVGGYLDLKTSLISDAALVSKRKTNQVNRISA